MVVSLVLALLALRTGLLLRRARLRKLPAPANTRPAHLRLAKLAVAMLLVGFAAGPPSAWLLRGWTPFTSFHGVAGGVAGALFLAAALKGRSLERGPARGGAGDPRSRDVHALLALLATAVGAMAAFAGFERLP